MKIFNFSRFHPFLQLLFLLAFVVAGFCLFSFLMLVSGFFFFGKGFMDETFLFSNDCPENVRLFFKWMQGFVEIGIMLIPALVFAYFYNKKPFNILKIRKIKPLWGIWIAIAFPFILLPLGAGLYEWSNTIKFPDFLDSLERYLRSTEDTAAKMTSIFLQADTILGLLLNILIIAVIPAISEEFLFRGVIQNIFKQWFHNVHWAVIVTAIVFSAVHGQFFGFLSRFALGLMLGYLFVTMQSIWAPVIAHFVNNGTAAVVAFLESENIIETTSEEFGTMKNTEMWGLIGATVTVAIFYLLWRRNRKDSKNHVSSI